MSKRESRKGREAKLDMTPMIDVVFQLIVFFILTMTITIPEIKDVALPAALTAEEEKDEEDLYMVHLWNYDDSAKKKENPSPESGSWRIWLPRINEGLTDVEEISKHIEEAASLHDAGTKEMGPGLELFEMEVLVRGDMRCPSHYFALLLESCIAAKVYKVKVSIAPNPEDVKKFG